MLAARTRALTDATVALPAALAATAAALVCAIAWGSGLLFVVCALGGFAIGFAGAPRPLAWLALALAVAGVCVAVDVTDDNLVPQLLLLGTAFGAARSLRANDAVTRRLAERAAELESERELYAELSVRYERARIAAELHDIVAHAISVMVVQAGAGQRLAAADPDRTRETFANIAGAAREAEADMHRLAELLGSTAADPRGSAGADLALVTELVQRAAGSGLGVSLRLEVAGHDLPGDLAHSVYRIVQEGLTNALRHAPGAPVSVEIRAEPGGRGVLVTVANGAPPPRVAGASAVATTAGTGNGLRGLRERVDAHGGALVAGPDARGEGWELSARLPLRAGLAGTR